MHIASRLIGVLIAVGLAPTHAAETIAFDTIGGDAWQLELPISGTIDGARCDQVVVQSPRASVNATIVAQRFFVTVPLQNGDNTLHALCRRQDRTIARAREQTWHLALPDTPKARVRIRIDGRNVVLNANGSERAPVANVPIVAREWYAEPGNPTQLTLADGSRLDEGSSARKNEISIVVPPRDGEYYVRLQVTDALGQHDFGRTVFRVANGEARIISIADEHPAWLDSAVLYGAAPYMFTPPSFSGVRERLDEIAALGATAIWLSPVSQAAPDDFGYSVTDQFAFRDDFGGEREFRALVDRAHRRGLRVLVDFVPNHFSQFHRYYAHALEHSERSPYYTWFDRDAAGTVTQYFDWAHLKNLNFDNPAVRNHIIAAAARFVRDFGVDGFRIDASWAVARRAPEFWPLLRAELKRIDPNIVLIAEASAREPYHVANGFDAAYDWTLNLGEWAWRDVFGPDGAVDVSRLRRALTNDDKGYPPDSLILRFLNNNDTGERLISRTGERTAALAATLLFTLPGIPLIYNGDEQGAQFSPYDEGPPIAWQDNALTAHYRRLAMLRRDVPSLRTRAMQMIRTRNDQDVLTYLRPAQPGSPDTLVLLNFSERNLDVTPDGASEREIFARFAAASDILNDVPIRFSPRRPTVRVSAKSARILQIVPKK